MLKCDVINLQDNKMKGQLATHKKGVRSLCNEKVDTSYFSIYNILSVSNRSTLIYF